MLMSYVPILNSVLLPLWSVKFYNFLPNSKSQRDLRVFCNKEISVVAALGSTCLFIETLLLIEMKLSRPATLLTIDTRRLLNELFERLVIAFPHGIFE